MPKSNSNLLNYISLLMHDDDALHHFLVDPIQAEENHGITKAERAVLRRTVAHLSNNSKNGYTVARHAGSYRRSLRLLQNVLHNVGSKMTQDATAAEVSSNNKDIVVFPYSMVFNFPKFAEDEDYTKMTNDQVGNPYGYSSAPLTVNLLNPAATIQEVLEAIKSKYNTDTFFVDYETVNIDGKPYVTSIIYNVTLFTSGKSLNFLTKASASIELYKLSDDYVFWFYSINGEPNKNGNPVTTGTAGQSFADYKLSQNDTVFWQLIAPDNTYGFHPCDATPGNANTNS
ncbi:MAG: hypothetical protein AB8B65_14605 [Kordia sp.]|uniref:hypothetical protein n=1 Tax=Kordia sp. TaxID=1965332 RepID=UPI00385BC6B5